VKPRDLPCVSFVRCISAKTPGATWLDRWHTDERPDSIDGLCTIFRVRQEIGRNAGSRHQIHVDAVQRAVTGGSMPRKINEPSVNDRNSLCDRRRPLFSQRMCHKNHFWSVCSAIISMREMTAEVRCCWSECLHSGNLPREHLAIWNGREIRQRELAHFLRRRPDRKGPGRSNHATPARGATKLASYRSCASAVDKLQKRASLRHHAVYSCERSA